MKYRLVAFGVALLAGLLVVACSRGDDGGTDDDAGKLLQGMVLTADQLPQGLEQVSTSTSTNGELASAAANPEAELSRLEALGRRLGYEVQFAPGKDAPAGLVVQGVQNTVSLFKAASGAGKSLSDGLTAARTTDWKAAHGDLQDVQVEQPPVPKDADEGAWFRITGKGSEGGLVIDDQIAFRIENVRAFLRVVLLLPPGTARDAYQDEVQQWVTLEARRIRDVLHGAPGRSPTS